MSSLDAQVIEAALRGRAEGRQGIPQPDPGTTDLKPTEIDVHSVIGERQFLA